MSDGRMSFKCGIISLIILLNITGSLGETLRVTCSPQTICALRESTETLQCSHSNTNIKPQHSFWFSPKQKAKWRNEEDPEDLALDSDYAGRVRYDKTTRYSYSYDTLTISDLRERDSGEYHLMVITETGQKYSSSTAVTLTVSDLKMRMTTDTKNQMELTCSSSCSLTSKPSYYYWYKNGRYQHKTNEHQKVLSSYSSDDPGSYSCSVSSHPEIRSNTVCINDENCWSVTYSDRRVCALEGSSVDFPCTYSYPRDQRVTKTFWYYFRPQVEPTDLSVEEQFAGRVEFLGDKVRNCALRMNNLTKSDSGQYCFRFITDTAGGSFSGYPGVILSVTDLQVKVSPTTPSEGQTVTLTCISTCTLPNNPTYIWYKNGQPVTNKPTRYNKLYLESASTEDVLQYSCALGGPEESTVLKFVTVGVAAFLALLLIIGWIWMRRRKSSPAKGHNNTGENVQCDSTAVYSNLSDLAMTSDPTQRDESDNQDGVHYSSVEFKRSYIQKEAPPPASSLPLYFIEDQDVQYAAVNFSSDSAAPQ
ncbi:uncharacterized protein LOC118826860 [Colossoma macropomum]|uniref:uncharacterized protein LOC118826860 n=1 Tax=Colossoma macropomum TaxID=42526 RepID=UPI0018641743|nr:uncharacterized protein LOC118826860 [Colossoma macropomum]